MFVETAAIVTFISSKGFIGAMSSCTFFGLYRRSKAKQLKRHMKAAREKEALAKRLPRLFTTKVDIQSKGNIVFGVLLNKQRPPLFLANGACFEDCQYIANSGLQHSKAYQGRCRVSIIIEHMGILHEVLFDDLSMLHGINLVYQMIHFEKT